MPAMCRSRRRSALNFSRPIVLTTTLNLPTSLPELGFDPPLAGSVTWIDPATVLFRPAAPLRAGARYQVTLAAGLADLAGSTLGEAFSWGFGTVAPKALAVTPPAGARWVAPRAPLVLTLSQPLDPATIAAGLVISPTNAGTINTLLLPDGIQVITYTPAADWRPGTTYTAALAVGDLVGRPAARWSFTTAPRPMLIGRFPGEGQTLPPGQEIRLVFNTPMDDAALRETVQFTPTVDTIGVTASNAEVRIAAQMRPATVYTVTIPSTLADRNGVPLGQEYRIRFLTAPAGPALALPEAPNHIAQVLPGQPLGLLLQRTNLSALNLDLYQLDEATIVRTLAFNESDWLSFQPERYGQPQLRSWNIQLADPLNTPVEDQLPLAAIEGQPLAPGAYYLRLRTPEGPRGDVLLLVSRSRLVLQESSAGMQLWATDVLSGTPVGQLPLALYQGGALIRQGTTDALGLWAIGRAGAAPETTVAVAGGDSFGVTSSAWAGSRREPESSRYRVFLTADRASYQPGDQVGLAGFARRTDGLSDTLMLPPAGLQVVLSARRSGATSRAYQEVRSVSAAGVFSSTFTLAADAAPGAYALTASLDDEVFETSFVVQPVARPSLQVDIVTPGTLTAGDVAALAVDVRTPEGLPVAGATVSWTLSAERAPLPTLEGYTIGDDELVFSPPVARVGQGQTGPDGRFGIIITDTVAEGAPVLYRLAARAVEPAGPTAEAERSFLALPAQAYVGVRLPSRVVVAGRPGAVEVLATTPDRRPVVQAPVQIEIYRRTWSQGDAPAQGAQPPILQPRDELVFDRQVTTEVDGTAILSPTLRAGGEYRVRATLEDASGRRISSATSLWVAAAGFTDWRSKLDNTPILVADRPSYRPGETATLLLTTPLEEATALLTLDRDGAIVSEVRTIRAGEPFTITLTPEDAPSVQVAALLAGPPSATTAASIGPPAPPISAMTTLPVLAQPEALSVTLTTDYESYAPGATATMTVTTADAAGQGLPADIVLSVMSASDAPSSAIIDAFRDTIPSQAAPQPTARPPVGYAPDQPPVGVYWNPQLHTNSGGVLTLTVRLPSEPADLLALVWAAGADRFGQARSTLAVTRPLALRAELPPFFHAGDEAELAVSIRNTSPISQEVRATLAAGGVEPLSGTPLTQRITIAPGATARVAWPGRAGSVPIASVSFSAQTTDGTVETIQFERPIVPIALAHSSGGALVAGRWTQPLTVTVDRQQTWGQLELDLAPASLVLAQDFVRSRAGLPERDLLDEAGLLLISATLSDTRTLARAALDRLVAEQRDDGGWAWWHGGRSDPFVSAVVLEAFAAAEGASLDVPDEVIARGFTAIESDAGASPGLRAYALYIRALHDRADPQVLADLAARPQALGPDGLAYLLLADPPDALQEPLLNRLAALAVRENGMAHWIARPDRAMLQSDIGATALVLLALERAEPEDGLIPEARRWLADARSVGGWPAATDAARAILALRASEPPSRDGRYVVALNGAEILDEPITTAITSTRRLTIPLAQLRERNELLVTSSGGAVYISYRLTVVAPAPPPHADRIGLLREYINPLTGRPADPARLRPGQLVRVQLSVIATAAQRFVTIEERLPAGAVVVEAGTGEHFEHIVRAGDRLLLSRGLLPPGIYEYTYLLRAVTPGQYSAPAPQARSATGEILGVGNAVTVTIAGR